MSFRELALNYLCRFEGMPIVEADAILAHISVTP